MLTPSAVPAKATHLVVDQEEVRAAQLRVVQAAAMPANPQAETADPVVRAVQTVHPAQVAPAGLPVPAVPAVPADRVDQAVAPAARNKRVFPAGTIRPSLECITLCPCDRFRSHGHSRLGCLI